jgi:hypothetical protein
MGLAADIITWFDAQWAAGTGGTKPSWKVYSKNMEHTAVLSCLLEEMSFVPDAFDIRNSVFESSQRCRLEYKCADRTDADKKLVETKRLCTASSIASGQWTPGEVKFDEYPDFTLVEIYVEQYKIA